MAGFRLGDHEFRELGGPAAPLQRLVQQPRSPIRNAAPPSFAAEFTKPPAPDGPAALLVDGSFCGHGEPTFTVFDIVVGGQQELELAVPFELDDEPIVRVRPAGSAGPWETLLALSELFECCQRDSAGNEPQPVADEDGQPVRVRAAIGFEYPCDTESAEDVSWIAIAVQYGAERAVVFSMETA